MKTPQQETLESERALVGEEVKCHDCEKKAEWIWPGNSDHPFVYCTECLAKAKYRLLVALGAAEALPH